MENRAKQIIVEILQAALAGKIDTSTNVNPQHIADAIAAKVVFEKTYSTYNKDEVIGKLIDEIVSYHDEMKGELDKIDIEEERLLKNFMLGKLAAYNEVLDLIDNL